MTLYRTVLLLLPLSLAVACGGDDVCGPAENNDGGYADASLDAPGVVAAADFAAAEIAGAEDPAYELVCAQTQVVAGTNYRLGLDIDALTWRAVVFEPLEGDPDADGLELISSEQID